MENEYYISIDIFRNMFGTPTEINGITGRINHNHIFYPDNELDRIISDHINKDGMIKIPIENKTKYFKKKRRGNK
ncbi:MAG: hypothetical protein ACOC33_03245 [bacterium]